MKIDAGSGFLLPFFLFLCCRISYEIYECYVLYTTAISCIPHDLKEKEKRKKNTLRGAHAISSNYTSRRWKTMALVATVRATPQRLIVAIAD